MSGILSAVTKGLTITQHADWLIFVERLKELTLSGRITRILALKTHYFADGDEWYLDPETGEIYVHGVPNAPKLPNWEQFDLMKHTRTPGPRPTSLSAIPAGMMSRVQTLSLKALLSFLTRKGIAEALDPSNNEAESEGSTEKWFRDTQTKVVYRLIEDKHSGNGLWATVPKSELKLQ
jgi:hypothetical protein